MCILTYLKCLPVAIQSLEISKPVFDLKLKGIGVICAFMWKWNGIDIGRMVIVSSILKWHLYCRLPVSINRMLLYISFPISITLNWTIRDDPSTTILEMRHTPTENG